VILPFIDEDKIKKEERWEMYSYISVGEFFLPLNKMKKLRREEARKEED
jgi:hypothetical protein